MIYLPILICLVGALIWLVCNWTGKYSEWGELGRISFGVGLLVFLMGGK